MNITPFCQICTAYFPSGARCPVCNQPRVPLMTPPFPGQALWHANLSGSAAQQLMLVSLNRRLLLFVPWNFTPQCDDLRPPEGGLTLIDTTDGSEVWTQALGAKIAGISSKLDETAWVGMGHLGGGTLGGSVAALDLAQAKLLWRTSLLGAVQAAPTVDQVRLYVVDCNGTLSCLDTRNGALLWQQTVADQDTVITASPVLLQEKGRTQAILVVTHGRRYGREPGRIIALETQGNILWEKKLDGNARGTPIAVNRRVYVTAYGDRPSRGLLLALNSRNGNIIWSFSRQGGQGSHNFSAAPCVHRDTVYVASLDHHLYALDAATGELRWQHDLGKGSACQPLWLRGLVLCGANDGRIYAVDAATGARAWEFYLGGHIFTTPHPFPAGVLVANDRGDVAALPWHLGRYAWAAERQARAGHFSVAGDSRALAAHHAPTAAARDEAYLQAQADWERAGEYEKVGALWLALDQREKAAAAFQQAGEHWQHKDACRAAAYFKRAAELYFAMRQAAPLEACARALSLCARLPHLRLDPVETGFVQWEPSRFLLRLTNEGPTPGLGVRLCLLGGALQGALEATFDKPILAEERWDIPLIVTPTQRESELVLELTYTSEHDAYNPLRGLFTYTLRAAERPQPALQLGDVGLLRLEIAGSTAEGVTINTQEIGLLRERPPRG